METGASNYRAAATLPDDSCTYLYPGCMSSAAFNYDATANQAGLCVPVRRGCMVSGAFNFYADANFNDDSCLFAGATPTPYPCPCPYPCPYPCSYPCPYPYPYPYPYP